jgi:hypothetical protein
VSDDLIERLKEQFHPVCDEAAAALEERAAQVAGLSHKIGELEDALAEARRDKERLDWLAPQGVRGCHWEDGEDVPGENNLTTWSISEWDDDAIPPHDLRTVIDAARDAEMV